jgi:hypothetical protein
MERTMEANIEEIAKDSNKHENVNTQAGEYVW